MPELPEVETVKRGLARLLPGKVLLKVEFDWPKSFPNSPIDVDTFLIGATVKEVRRRAKVLIIDLSSNYSLIIHLKMTGQLVFVGKNLVDRRLKIEDSKNQKPSSNYHLPTSKDEVRFGAGHPSASLVGKLPDKSTRVIFDFDDAYLFFNDQRKFGWVKLVPTTEIPNIDFFKKVGPEPLESDFTAQDFINRLKRRPKSAIKSILLDQTIVAGVGNIYADESLWAAKIHPLANLNTISAQKLKNLYTKLINILKLSIEKGGSTDRNYVDAEGKKGSYLSFANVFRRQGQPCARCGSIIIKIRAAGRGTHLCPKCQKAPI